MELKLDKTTKILLGAIALGLFLNASNVFIDKAFAENSAGVQKVVICNVGGFRCAKVTNFGVWTYPDQIKEEE